MSEVFSPLEATSWVEEVTHEVSVLGPLEKMLLFTDHSVPIRPELISQLQKKPKKTQANNKRKTNKKPTKQQNSNN